MEQGAKTQYLNLTEGSVAKGLIRFALPFVISSFLQACLNLADILILERFVGAVATSAAGVGGQVTFLLTNAVIGFATGGTILIARFFGAGDQNSLKKTLNTMFALFVILAVGFTVIFLIANPFILRAMQTPDEAFGDAKAYLNITTTGLIFIFLYNGISGALRGMGDSKSPLYFIAFACVVNVGLDIVAVKYLNMGPAGAAWATVISQALSVVLSLIYLLKKKGLFNVKEIRFKIDKVILKEVLHLGIPTALQNSLITLSFMFLTSIVNVIGANDGERMALHTSSANVLSTKYNGFAILPARAVASAISSMVSQNIGAKKTKRTRDTFVVGLIISVSIGTVILIVTQLFTKELFSFFSNDPDTMRYGIVLMQAMAWDYALMPIAASMFGYLDGWGRTTVTSIVNTVSAVAIRVPLGYLLGITFGMGMAGVGYALPISSLVSGLIVYTYALIKRKEFDVNNPKNILVGSPVNFDA